MPVDTRGAKRRRLEESQAPPRPSGGSSMLGIPHTVKMEENLTCPSLRPFKEAAAADIGKEVRNYDTFHPFQRLPPELRVHIWREVAEDATVPFHPLRVRVYRGTERVHRPGQKRPFYVKNVLRLATMPDLGIVTRKRRNLLQINKECRGEVLKLWDSSLKMERGRVLRFSYKYDIVYLDIINPAVMDDFMTLRQNDELPEFTNAIGHIGFDMTPSVPLWMITNHEDLEPQLRLLLCFPRLHTMSLVAFGAFEPEINWQSEADAQWVLVRSRGHRVYLRGFPALEGINYHALQSTIGNRSPTPMIKHDCAICTIHKCVYVNEVLGSSQARQARLLSRSELEPEELAFLRNLEHHTLMATKPLLAKRLPVYQSGTHRWWKNRPPVQPPPHHDQVVDDHNHGDEESDFGSDGDDDDDVLVQHLVVGGDGNDVVQGVFIGGHPDEDSDDMDIHDHFHHDDDDGSSDDDFFN
ncbi:hypothetical protein Sste5346_003848 [Sporothrix stenoceras]|uniref:2EXR domain-containing protein n=1 Tax=Sporothrix stenoceras TaxID=5173 RepID=A0ABR3ZCJ1_9PEZI